MKKIGILLIASTLVLSACGKRSDDTLAPAAAGYDENGDLITPTIGAAIGTDVSVRVISSEPSLKTGGQETAEITAVVTNENNLPMADIAIVFSTTSGVLQSAEVVTDENGEATAVLTLRYDSANQDIIVTALAGTFQGSARVVATGSTLEISGDDNVVLGSDIDVVAVLTAGDGKPISNEMISVTSQAGNTLSAASGITDPEGNVTVTVGSANGNDTLSFSALNDSTGAPSVNAQYSFVVSDDQLKFADNTPTELTVNDTHEISVNWSFNGAPIVGEEVKFTITAGEVISGADMTTDNNGNVSVSVSSGIAGEVTLHAEATDGSVNNKHTFSFVGVTPDTIRVSSSSTRVNTRDNASITALVQDVNGNPVTDTVVIFSSSNLKGGQLSSTTATTNANGEAVITFNAGTAATDQNEITISAEVEGSNIMESESLTVVEPALNITIGSSNNIEKIGNDTQYSIPYVVQVADGGGQALEGAKVTLSIEPMVYRKGIHVLTDSKRRIASDISDDEQFTPEQWEALLYSPTARIYSAIECEKEDANGNRILDVSDDPELNEDKNLNGSLDPQDPAVIMATLEEFNLNTIEANGVITTDATGSGYFNVVYPASNAGWSKIRVVARAQALGVEAEDDYPTNLLSLATEITNILAQPVNIISPFGVELDCTTTD